MRALRLQFHGGMFTVTADGAQAESLLERLAFILDSETIACPGETAAELHLSTTAPEGDGWEPWKGAVRLPAEVHWKPDSCRYHWRLTDGIDYAGDAAICWRTLVRVFHQCASNRIVRTDSLQMHGALLNLEGNGIILFADCGVGKSTSCRRFRRGGGEVLGDDKMMLHFAEDGMVYAQPAPTWSRPIFSPRMRFPFSTVVPVRGLFLLTRGKGDEIHPAESARWHGELLQSSFNFFERPMDWADKRLRAKVTMRNIELVDRLWKRFPPLEIHGDLQGDLFGNLSAWLKESGAVSGKQQGE